MPLKKALLATLALAVLARTPASAATFLALDGVDIVFDPADGQLLSSRRQTFVTGEPADWAAFAFLSVPEPTTWTMMFVGFASIGLAIRSRGRRTAKPVSA
jgi:hypothetical protein